jgi:hypothetical protein
MVPLRQGERGCVLRSAASAWEPHWSLTWWPNTGAWHADWQRIADAIRAHNGEVHAFFPAGPAVEGKVAATEEQLVNGGCSDDLFVYFRLWLVGQGREYFERALREPERAADRAVPYESDCEDLLYAGRTAHMEATGEDLPRADEGDPSEPVGDPWTESDLQRRFPVVAARFA